MVSLKDVSMAGGEIGPQLFGRSDQQKYASGLRFARNMIITRFGGSENRAGTLYLGSVKHPAQPVRLVKFVITSTISYLLEIGDYYIRPWKNGARINVSGAAAWSNATAYGVGDLVTDAGNVYWCVTPNTNQQPSGGGASYWNLQVGGLLEILTVIPPNALTTMQYVQRNSIMTIVSQLFPPQQLLCYSDTRWVIQTLKTGPGINPPAGINAIAGVAASGYLTGGVDNVTVVGGNPSLPNSLYVIYASTAGNSSAPSYPIPAQGGVDAFNSPVITWSAFPAATGYCIFRNVGGGVYARIGTTGAGVTTLTDFNLTPNMGFLIPGLAASQIQYVYAVTAVSAVSGVESFISLLATCIGGTPTASNPNVISWTMFPAAASYNVYRLTNGLWAYVGSSNSESFNDINIQPLATVQPPVAIPMFKTSNDWPAVVAYFQQRLLFANTVNQPQTVWGSRIGYDTVFQLGLPVTDQDTIQFTIASKQVSPIQALVDVGKLIIHTFSAELVANGNQYGTLTPTAVNIVGQGTAGSKLLQPVAIGTTDLFVQGRGGTIRDLRFEIQSSSYTGKDVTTFAPHLFVGRSIVDMDWQPTKHSIVWVVLDNGQLLGLSYVREHDIWAWHHHDTVVGFYESVVVVQEGNEDVLYVSVRRIIAGATVRYLERFVQRDFLDTVNLTDAHFVDCGLVYDGRNVDVTNFMQLTTGATWTPRDQIVMVSTNPVFSAGDIGNDIVMQQLADGSQLQPGSTVPYPVGTVIDQVSITINTYTNARRALGTPSKTVPAWAQNVLGLITWGKAVKSFSGIAHLNGQTLAMLGDGNVVPPVVVAAGAFTTDQNYMVLRAGLPITAELQTLPVENDKGETILNKNSKITEMTPVFYLTRGGQYGQDMNHLQPWIQRQSESLGQPTALYTGPVRVPVSGTWQKTGQIFARQSDPLPLGISAIIITGLIGD